MFFKILLIAVPFIWFGAVAAISFMEAPLKFTAPNVTLPLGLGIGYVVFHALNKVEIVLCILMASALFFVKPRNKNSIAVFCLIVLILFLQTFWLFPLLDERTMNVIAGNAKPYSNLHVFYIVFDSIKIVSLIVLGIFSISGATKITRL